MRFGELYVQRPGAELLTQAVGDAVKGTIVLAMGATASMVWWPDAFLEALADAGYKVIRFDHRDTGRSTLSLPGALPYDVGDLAEDVVAIIDAYDVQSAHLVGMSLGGLVAQMVALKHPARVKTLTLFAAEPLGHDYDGQGMPAEMMEHFGGIATLDWSDRAAVTAFLLRIAELSAAPGRPFDRQAALDRIGRELDHTQRIQNAFNHAMLKGDIDPGMTIENISQPTLVVHGDADPLISVSAAKKTASLLKQARLLVLEDVGHEFTPAEIPGISKAIIEFVGGGGRQGD